MKKKILSIVLALALVVTSSICIIAANADDVNWSFDRETKILHIFGSGRMENFDAEFECPWSNHLYEIEQIDIDEGVTSIGDYSFAGANRLESVSIPSTLTSVGSFSFASCQNLNSLFFGPNITSIADSSFSYNGITPKENFTLYVNYGSYALDFCITNEVNFSSPKINCDTYNVKISNGGMIAYYPFTPVYNGTYSVRSTGNYDTVGAIFDSSFTKLVENDDYGSSSNFKCTYEMNAGQTYYIAARMLSHVIKGSFNMIMEPVSYTAVCKLFAAQNPSGQPSSIPLTSVEHNGALVDAELELEISGTTSEETFTYGNQSKTVTISPNYECVITFITCDVNNDGWINAKDFAIMNKTDSPYKPLFNNFLNYHIENDNSGNEDPNDPGDLDDF